MMNTIFEKNTVDSLVERINALSVLSRGRWGKMDAFQMLKHCCMSEEVFLGKRQYKRMFAGKLFGKMALNSLLKNSTPFKKNLPTHPELKITGSGDAEAEKLKWESLLKEYQHYSDVNFVHPFFGKMTREQIGYFVYKHTDHHLRQFGE